jgi:hypothetical protein
VDEFDRILDGQDVTVLVAVLVVDHRGQRGRLSRPGRARNQHDPAGGVRDILEYLRAVQFLERENLQRNGSKYRARATMVVECIDPETRESWNLEGEVRLEKFFEILALFVIHDVVDEIMNGLVIDRGDVYAAHVAVDSDHGRQTRRKMQIGCSVLDAERKQRTNIYSSVLALTIRLPGRRAGVPQN